MLISYAERLWQWGLIFINTHIPRQRHRTQHWQYFNVNGCQLNQYYVCYGIL